MQENERQILRQFAVDLKQDVIPIDMLPHLWCLTEDDYESIQYKQDRDGPRAAVPILLERLKKRKGAFNQLLTGLERTGCSHLKTLLQNAMEDQTPYPEPEHNSRTLTPETSNVGSTSCKTPTTETARPFSEDSFTKTMLPLKSVTSKRANKTPKKKTEQIPKENTTSPPVTKTYTKTKTKPLKFQPPHKSSKTQQITKCSSKKNPKPICTSAKTDPKTDFIENPTTQFDTLLCYAKENCEIALELKQFLETRFGLTVCIDLINFIPGKAITDNICESINSSQSIIFLLSSEFPGKFWAQWELKHAVYDSNASQKCGKCKKIIPVLLEECQVPNDLKIYTAIKLGGSGSKMGAWKKIAEALLGRPLSVDDDDGNCVEDSVDDVVSNDDSLNDEVDNSITDNVLDGYDNHGDNNNGISEVGVDTDSSDTAVEESNNGGSYHGDVDNVVGTGNGEDDNDDGSDDASDCIKDDSSGEDDDDDSSDGVDDCSGGGDCDEDGHYTNNSSNDGANIKNILDGNYDDAGHDHVDNNDSDKAGDDKHLNQNACDIHNGVGEHDDSGDNNNDVSTNNENKDGNVCNNIKSL